MPDMRLPYAHLESEIESFKREAKRARQDIMKLTVKAETYKEAARCMGYAIEKQVKADELIIGQSTATKET